MIGFIDGYFGWLANQMFQYAATRALAHRRGVECTFPRNQPNLHDVFHLTAHPVGYAVPATVLYREPHFHFDPAAIDLPDNTILSGYFQSEKYFASCADLIRREFTFRDLHTPDKPGVVSVHVRRGDYCKLGDHHPLLGLDYYARAMAQWPDGTEYLVFSDDPEWCDQHMGGWPGVQVAEKRSAAADMDLMSRCGGGHIIANSSFSWWGAWIGETPGKRIVTPLAWFGPAKAGWDTRDLIPERWTRL